MKIFVRGVESECPIEGAIWELIYSGESYIQNKPMAVYGWVLDIETLEDLFDLIESSGTPFILENMEVGPSMMVMPIQEEFLVDGS